MIRDAINTAFRKKEERGWDNWPKVFWAIDLHDVIIPGNYTRNNDDKDFYPCAQKVLQWLTNREDMCLILFTCSHDEATKSILEWLEDRKIRFDYVNENPECADSELCTFKNKFYFDILLEDKAGFNGVSDWYNIVNSLNALGEWSKKKSHSDTLEYV